MEIGCGPRDPGERVYVRKCAGCHGRAGASTASYRARFPNADLTDGVWRHGSDLAAMKRLITEGDPRSPMPRFEGRLDPEEIEAVARYVERLVHTSREAKRPKEQ
jgi:mono/diheme cytochrome c family protein